MAYLAGFEISPGRDVLVEVDSTEDGFEPLGNLDDGIVRSAAGFSDRLDTIRDAVTETLTKLGDKLNPDEITISFGIKSPLDYSVFSASAAALLVAIYQVRNAAAHS